MRNFSIKVVAAPIVTVLIFSGLFCIAQEAPRLQRNFQVPLGKNVGNVEFNAMIRLNAPIVKEKTVLFLHYKVSVKAISYNIVWAEPVWEHLNFPYPPSGLNMYADESQYMVSHSFDDVRWSKKLTEERNRVFMSTCNTYPLEESGYAYKSFLSRRLFQKDLDVLVKSKNTNKKVPISRDSTRREIEIYMVEGRSDYTQFQMTIDASKEHYFEIGYFFNNDRLKYMPSTAPETIIPVSGFEIKARSNVFPQGITITQLPAKYHKGGRNFDVSFERIELRNESIDIPVNISVIESIAHSKNGLLRNAVLSDYRCTDEEISSQNFAEFFLSDPLFKEEQIFRILSTKYWLKEKSYISADDLKWFSDFADKCCVRLHDENRLPYRLRLLYMLICSDLMCDNMERVELSFNIYLSCLKDAGLEDIADKAREQFVSLCNKWHKHLSLPIHIQKNSDDKEENMSQTIE